jgi:hypothetical protein
LNTVSLEYKSSDFLDNGIEHYSFLCYSEAAIDELSNTSPSLLENAPASEADFHNEISCSYLGAGLSVLGLHRDKSPSSWC